jgi:molecular chaperone DnaK (HSP70)
MEFMVFEGSSEGNDSHSFIRRLEANNIPEAPKDCYGVYVNFDVDSNGILYTTT